MSPKKPTNTPKRGGTQKSKKMSSGASKEHGNELRKIIKRACGLVVRATATQTCIAEGPGFESRQVHFSRTRPTAHKSTSPQAQQAY